MRPLFMYDVPLCGWTGTLSPDFGVYRVWETHRNLCRFAWQFCIAVFRILCPTLLL